jgi:hypothetical protein
MLRVVCFVFALPSNIKIFLFLINLGESEGGGCANICAPDVCLNLGAWNKQILHRSLTFLKSN